MCPRWQPDHIRPSRPGLQYLVAADGAWGGRHLAGHRWACRRRSAGGRRVGHHPDGESGESDGGSGRVDGQFRDQVTNSVGGGIDAPSSFRGDVAAEAISGWSRCQVVSIRAVKQLIVAIAKPPWTTS